MRRGPCLAALLLLSGCYVQQPPPPPIYGYPPPPPGYPAAAYPPPYDPSYAAYPGYDYNGGAPTVVYGGAPVPLILLGGEWGFYDGGHRWHRAPDAVHRDLAARGFHPGGFQPGAGARPPAYPQGRPIGTPAAEQRPARPEPSRQEQQQHRRDCPQGQRCY